MIPVSVRLNPFKAKDLSLPILDGSVPVPWSEHGRILKERPKFTLDPLFHAACYYVQDSSAMYVGHVFRKFLSEQQKNIKVLDLCAAPGGKTTDLVASLRQNFGDEFMLVANEVIKKRARILDDNVARWGDPNVVVTSVDPAAFAALGEYFDIIVADVPCSGEGMFRKDSSAREQWSQDLVNLCASRQKRILSDVWPSLKRGGILIYSTCTYQKAENDDNLLWASQELGAQVLPLDNEFSAYGVRSTEYGLLLRAGEVPGEGQWVGAMRKTSSDPLHKNPDIAILKPLRRGVLEGSMKGKDFVPSADWALSINYPRGRYPEVELDLDMALKYLHADSLVLPGEPLGYLLLCYRSVPLGFVKNIGSRCNNLLPRDRKIHMDI